PGLFCASTKFCVQLIPLRVTVSRSRFPLLLVHVAAPAEQYANDKVSRPEPILAEVGCNLLLYCQDSIQPPLPFVTASRIEASAPCGAYVMLVAKLLAPQSGPLATRSARPAPS